MTESQMALTHLEETTALAQAHISPDMETWDDATWAAADMVLEVAQNAKIERLTVRHKTPEPAGYTLADMASDLGDYFDKTEAAQ